MVLLCFVAFMLCNMDRVNMSRVNMSIAILPMSQQYGWNSQTVGLVQSSFFWYVRGWGERGVLLSSCWIMVIDIVTSVAGGGGGGGGEGGGEGGGYSLEGGG